MPAKKSPAWDIRIDAFEGLENNLRPWCEENGAVLVVKELADEESSNPHYHIAIRTLEITDEAIRKRIKKLAPGISGNKDYSLRSWDGNEKLLRYYCKGPAWQDIKSGKTTKGVPELPEVFYTTLTRDEICKYNEEFWKENSAKTESLKNSKVKKADDVVQLAVDHLKAIQSSGRHITYERGSRLAFSFIFDHYKGRVGKYALQNMIQSVLWSFSSDTRQKLKLAMFAQIERGLELPQAMSGGCETDLLGDLISHQ